MRMQVELMPEDSAAAIQLLTCSAESNISNAAEKVIDNKTKGYVGFQLSGSLNKYCSKLDGSYRFFPSSGYAGFVSKAIADERGLFDQAVTIDIMTIGINTPKVLCIVFDDVDGTYARRLSVTTNVNDNIISIENNGTILVVSLAALDLPSNTYDSDIIITLNIQEWSRAYSSAKVSSISNATSIVFEGNDIIKFTCSENLLNKNVSTSPGICEQYADVVVYDRYDQLKAFIQSGTLEENCNLSIGVVLDTGVDTLGTYVVDSWSVPTVGRKISLTCKDRSCIFDAINVKGKSAKLMDRTLDDLLRLAFNATPTVAWQYASDAVRDRCRDILIPNNWLRDQKLSELLSKICTLGLLRIYWLVDKFIVEEADTWQTE